MEFAIIETGGKQYKVQEGDILKLEKLDVEPGAKVVFDRVFLLASRSKKTLKVGHPYLKEAKVEGKVLEHGRAEKIVVYKKKSKKRYSKKQGHRQPYSKVQIIKVES